MHRVQVVEDDGDLWISARELRRNRGSHRHDLWHPRRRPLQHLAETRDRRLDTGLPCLACGSRHERFVQSHLQPVVGPDQSVELGEAPPERQRVRLPLHELHGLRRRAERDVASRTVIGQEAVHLGVLTREWDALVRPDVVDLTMEYVRPLEHLLRLRNELRILDLDGRLLERNSRRVDEQPPRDEIILAFLEEGRRCTGLRQQPLVEDRVPVIERVEQSVGGRVVSPELPVVRRLAVKLLVGSRPLCVCQGRGKQPRRSGDGARACDHSATVLEVAAH